MDQNIERLIQFYKRAWNFKTHSKSLNIDTKTRITMLCEMKKKKGKEVSYGISKQEDYSWFYLRDLKIGAPSLPREMLNR